MPEIKKISVFGGGSWGTALACYAARVTGEVDIYVRDKEIIEEINIKHTNNKYLGQAIIDSRVTATDDINKIITADVIIIAVPSTGFHDCLQNLISYNISSDCILLIATKGISSTPVIQLFSDKIKSELANPFAFITGPNFAKEVINKQFTAATISSEDISLADELAAILSSDLFAIDSDDDIITCQISSIVKNIIAIKTGMLIAEGGGENAKAALVAKGLREIAAIARYMGGKEETLLKTGIVGDLILTCYSTTSRNTRFGYEFAKNNYSQQFLKDYPILVEGVEAGKLIFDLIAKYNINRLNIPLISSVVSLFKPGNI